MERNLQNAFNALERMGAPVREDWDGRSDTFIISAEDNSDEVWADYYGMSDGYNYGGALDDFGVNHRINAVLDRYGLMCEWINPGCLGVYRA